MRHSLTKVNISTDFDALSPPSNPVLGSFQGRAKPDPDPGCQWLIFSGEEASKKCDAFEPLIVKPLSVFCPRQIDCYSSV